jgi:F-type H+-transporting ATPase subunit epsilon
MQLTVLLPNEVLLDEAVQKVTAEAENGSFCLLPRHVDFVAALVPGLLVFEKEGGQETFIAIDEGVLVKFGDTVLVSTRNGVRGKQLGELKDAIESQFKVLDEREKKTRSAMAKIEAGFVRKFLEIQKNV